MGQAARGEPAAVKAGGRRPCATVLHEETRAAPPEERPGGGGEGPPRECDCVAQVTGGKPELGGTKARPEKPEGGRARGGSRPRRQWAAGPLK